MDRPPPQNIPWQAVLSAAKNVTAAVCIVAIVALVLLLGGCAVDTEKVTRTRADLETLCRGALTLPLKAACARAGVSTEPLKVEAHP